jgi:uncharacterized flavoprotein (TIGR03862 family)
MPTKQCAVIGAGPAGLIAAEVLAKSGATVTLYDRMRQPGRKLLLAGRGGLNLTHSEPLDDLLKRYGGAASRLGPAIEAFPPSALRTWSEELGETTFVGTSGRVFPKSMRASPLLRALLLRLRKLSVRFEMAQEWRGWTAERALAFVSQGGQLHTIHPTATVLALGGASWPRLGADGSWVPHFEAQGVQVTPLSPANCGARIAWTDHFRSRFEGEPLKRIALNLGEATARGEAVLTSSGLEGGVIYALVPEMRRELARAGKCLASLDLRPDLTVETLAERLSRLPTKQSASNRLRKAAGLSPSAIGLVFESHGPSLARDSASLARAVKHCPLEIVDLAPIGKAISCAGGVAWSELDGHYMLKRLPGVFAAGEMLDWEAPTGGYLLQACFSTGVAAAHGAAAYLSFSDGRPAAGEAEGATRPR